MSKKSRGRRDVSNIANPRLPFPSSFVRLPGQLDLFEDRRLFNPDPLPPARSFQSPRHRLVVPKQQASKNARGALPHFVGFRTPNKVLICVRRKIREEVMHALKKTGKRGQKKPRRNYYSDVRC